MADLKALAEENFKGMLSGILHVLSGPSTLRSSAKASQPEQCRIMSYGLKKKLYVPLFECVSKKEDKLQNWVHQRVSTEDLAGAELISSVAAHTVPWFNL